MNQTKFITVLSAILGYAIADMIEMYGEYNQTQIKREYHGSGYAFFVTMNFDEKVVKVNIGFQSSVHPVIYYDVEFKYVSGVDFNFDIETIANSAKDMWDYLRKG